jgi:hypothetical protein
MTDEGTKRTRYPEKISIVKITEAMRQQIDIALQQHPEMTEAEIVRNSLSKYLPKLIKPSSTKDD